MKNTLKNVFSITASITLMVSFAASTVQSAEDSDRQQRKEVFLTSQFMTGDSAVINKALTTELDSSFLLGVGFGYNLTERVNANAGVLLGYTDLTATLFDSIPLKDDSIILAWNANVDYNVWETRLTPFVTAGIGTINFTTTTVVDGYVLLSQSSMSFNLGGGVRWDVTDKIYLKGLYRATWSEMFENSEEYTLLDGFELSVGYLF